MDLLNTIWLFMMVAIPMILSIPIGLVFFMVSLPGLRKPMSVPIYYIGRLWALMLVKLTRCPVTVKGRENIPRAGGMCFVSNHGSIFDTVLLLAYIGRPFGFIAKKELLFAPFVNIWISLLGGLYIDRGRGRRALKTIEKGIQRIKAGGAMLIFPEGHRSRGEGLLKFHPGSLKLATRAEVPIIPVAISGSYDVFEKSYRVKAVPVKVIFGEPIPTSGLSPEERKQDLADKVRGVIAGMLETDGSAESSAEHT